MSLVSGLYLISMAPYDVLSLLFKLLNLILYFKTLNSHLCYFLLNIVIFICFSTYFFDNITLCINLPNVTLSNISHLVYITLSGETDGVTLSRLGCMTMSIPNDHVHITLFRSITVFCGTDSILQNIFYIESKWRHIPQHIVSPTKYCYGYEQFYAP